MIPELSARDTWDAADAARMTEAMALHQQQQIERGEIDSIAARANRKAEDALAIGHGPRPTRRDHAQRPPENDAFLIEGMIRPGTTVMLAGPPGAAKSWLREQIAISAAAGVVELLGHYHIGQPLRVLVVDEDNGEAEEWRREDALLGYLSLQRADLSSLYSISLSGQTLDGEAGQQWLRALILELGLDLLILDPISELHGGKELREDPAFAALRRFLKRLKVDYPNMATLLVHHTRKPAANDRGAPRTLEDVRGQWGQTPDVVALLSPLGEHRARWELHKRVPSSVLILEQVEGGGLACVADETTAAKRKSSSEDRVLGAIDAGATSADDIIAGTGIARSTVFDVIKRLRRAAILTPKGPLARVEVSG